MNRIKRYSAASILAGTILALSVTPGLAQTSPGPGWFLINQQTVSEWHADPVDPNGGKWNLISVTDRQYFLADGNFQRILNHAIPESGRDNMGISDRVYKAEKILKRTARDEFDRELKNPNRIYREGNSRVLTRLSRYSLWDDVDFETPWDKFHLFRNKNRALNHFRFQWTDPVVNKVLTEMDPVTEYTPWSYGAVYKEGIAESGIQPGFRIEKQRYVDRDEIVSKLALGVESLTAAAGSRAGLFSGDSGSGTAAPALEAAKVRTAMGANEAKAADVKASEADFDASQASLEELRKQFNDTLKTIIESGDADLKEIKDEFKAITDKQARQRLDDLFKDSEKFLKDAVKSLEEVAKDQYAFSKKTGTKLDVYRETLEKGLERVNDAYEQKAAELKSAYDSALAASNATKVEIVQQPVIQAIPQILATPQPVATPPVVLNDALAKAMGTYKNGAGSSLTLTRVGNSNNIKIDASFNGTLKGYVGTSGALDFNSKSAWKFTVTKGKHNRTLYVKFDNNKRVYLNSGGLGWESFNR